MVQFSPPQWGGVNVSIDYTPYIEGLTPIAAPIDITGHTFTGFGEEELEALKINIIKKVNGINRIKSQTVRSAQVTERTFTMGLGQGGPIWTPVMQRARRGDSNCKTSIFAVRNCPEDPQHEHAYAWPDCLIGPLKRPNDFIVNDSNGEPVAFTSDISASDELLIYKLGGFKKGAAADQLYDITFVTEDCATCSNVVYSDLVAVGGDGTSDMLIIYSDDRFATQSTIDTSALPEGAIGQCVFNDGDINIVGWADDVLATAAAGGIAVSSNYAAAVAATMPSTPGAIWDIIKFGGIYFAVGGLTGAQATIFESSDAFTWTAVSSGALPATDALLAAAADEEAGTIYVVGEGGACLKGTVSGDTLSFTTLTPTGVSTTNLLAVAVLEKDHVVVAGAGGYYAESLDGGTTWSRPPVPVGSTAITSVAGDRYRTVITYGTAYAVRDILNKNNFVVETLQNGGTFTGTLFAVTKVENTSEGFNYFAMVTAHTAGEIAVLQPFHPQA